jgi:hypothetical protein
VLLAGIVLSQPGLVPVAAILAGALYGAELAIASAPLDIGAPAVAAGLLVTVELAYWSIEERQRWSGRAGDGLRHAAFVALVGLAAFLVATALLVVIDAVRAKGLALDLLGAAAAAAVIVTILVLGRTQPSSGS